MYDNIIVGDDMKKIDGENKVFQSLEFQKDKYKFNLISKILLSPNLELYSDEDDYIICRSDKDMPTWIWTKDYFDRSKLSEIKQLIEMFLTDNSKDRFICKKELYDLLLSEELFCLNKDDYHEMGFLLCYETKLPREEKGELCLATEEDKGTIMEYWYLDCKETEGYTEISKEQVEKDVDGFLKTQKFYVLKDNGKIVCMGGYADYNGEAKINHVYTPKEERKKAYASNLIYKLTNKLLDEGLVPLLYTDYSNPASNTAYKNVGYEDQGILINFSCSKKRNRGI